MRQLNKNWSDNTSISYAGLKIRISFFLQAIGGQPIEEVNHLIHAREQMEGSQLLMGSQGTGSPLPVVPPRYPDRLKEILVENMNFHPMREVPLYQVHSWIGRQPMQYVEQTRGMQFRDWSPPATQMHCGRGWTDATESFAGIRCSRSVQETSQFPEQNQGGERMRASSYQRQLTLNRSVFVLKLSQTHIPSN